MTTSTRTREQIQWRNQASDALTAAGFDAIALQFKYCGDESQNFTLACKSDPLHYSRVCPKTCKNRFCAECESYAQSKRLAVYVPAIDKAMKTGPKSYQPRHIVLTTPIKLVDADCHDKLVKYWVYVPKALNRVAWRELNRWPALTAAQAKLRQKLQKEREAHELSSADVARLHDLERRLSRGEQRRGRIDWKQHSMGFLIGAEFGEDGHKLHFHILFWGCWIAGNWLTEEYRRLTNDESKVTKIKRVNDAGKGAKEVLAKYATKLSELPPSLVPTLHTVLKATRRVRSYGVFFDVPREELPSCSCDVCGAGLQIWNTEQFNQFVVDLAGVRAEAERLRAERSLLNLIHGNKSGEKRKTPPNRNQLSLPDMPPERINRLRYFDVLE